MTEIQPGSRKRQFHLTTPNWERCLCHVESVSGLLIPFSEKSWEKFEVCAQRRRDLIWEQMKGHWQGGPKGKYHRKCYQTYTHKTKVERAEKQQENVTKHDVEEQFDQPCLDKPPPKRLSRSQVEVFDKNKCAICQREKKSYNKTKGTRCKEALSLNMTDSGRDSLMKAAQIRDDSRLLLQIRAEDTIALELKYHKSCYKDYVRQETLSKYEEQNCQKEDAANDGYDRAFNKVKEYVQDAVIKQAKAVSVSELLQQYVSQLTVEGINAQNYRSSKLKNRLIKCFGDRLSFRQPADKKLSEIVYSAHVSTGAVVELVMKCSAGPQVDEEEVFEEVTPDAFEEDKYIQVFRAAKVIRSLVTDMKPVMAWPPTAEDLDCDSSMVPDLMYNLFAWILSPNVIYSTTRVSDVPSKVHRTVLSLAQDLIHCVGRGRIKTPKHVTLPFTVKSLTGNAELITILNRFGHGLSYSKIEELETALSEREIAKQQDGILVPSTCSPGVPAVFCWDNNDLLEETLSGITRRLTLKAIL